MKLSELQSSLEEQLTYPVETTTVIETIGATEIDAPDVDRSETVGAVLESVETDRYVTAEELFEAIIGNLPDEYIGRKFYDDRGGNPTGTVPGEETDSSL